MIPIISEIFGIGRDYLNNRQEIKKAEAEAKAKVIVKSADNLADWERIQAKNAQSSWKDEWFTVVLSIPLIFCFLPGFEEDIRRGFEVLNGTPEWYRWALFTAIGASYGVRKFGRFKK